MCCAYNTAMTARIKGYDCVMIAGAENTAGVMVKSNVCGRGGGLRTQANANKSVCCESKELVQIAMNISVFEAIRTDHELIGLLSCVGHKRLE